jgi:hypothetical protein
MNSFSPRSRPPWAKRWLSFAAAGSIWSTPLAVMISDPHGRVLGGGPTTTTPSTFRSTASIGMPLMIPGRIAVVGG